MVSPKRDCINAGAVLAVCVAGLVQSWRIPPFPFGATGPAFFPKIVFAVMTALAALYLLASVWQVRRQSAPALDFSVATFWRNNKPIVWLFVVFCLYAAVLPIIGYNVTTTAFLVVDYLILARSRRHLWAVVLGSAAFTFAVYLIFRYTLSILLPTGLLF